MSDISIKQINGWDPVAEELSLTLSDGNNFIVSADDLRKITDAMYNLGAKIQLNRPDSVFLVDEMMVGSVQRSLIFGFVTDQGQAANFQIRTNASESRLQDAVGSIQSAISDLRTRQQ